MVWLTNLYSKTCLILHLHVIHFSVLNNIDFHFHLTFALFNNTLSFPTQNFSPSAVWLNRIHCTSKPCNSCDEECRYLISAKYSLVSSLHGWHFVASEIQEWLKALEPLSLYWVLTTKYTVVENIITCRNKRPYCSPGKPDQTNTFAQSYDYIITLIRRGKKTIISFLRIE